MKKQLLLILLFLPLFNQIKAQCSGGSSFVITNAPTNTNAAIITSCNWGGDYNTITNCLTGVSYTFTTSPSAFITIRQGSTTGPVVGYGSSTVTITSPISGNLYMIINSNPSCGTGTTCITTTIKNNSATLPVSFGKFMASLQANKVKLNWNTFSEQNNQIFLVYRSTDGLSYTEIAQELSKGNGANSYTAFDNNPVSGINYYRLKQKDNNGTLTELANDVINFSFGGDEIQAWPNPVTKTLKVSFPSGKYRSLILAEITGKKLQEYTLTNKQINTDLDMSAYPKGIYLIGLKGDKGNSWIKISK